MSVLNKLVVLVVLRPLSRSLRAAGRGTRFLLALAGVSSIAFGTGVTDASANVARDRLENRVAEARALLRAVTDSPPQQDATEAGGQVPNTLVQYWPNWGNWPNWNNWYDWVDWPNWPNWGNWYNY